MHLNIYNRPNEEITCVDLEEGDQGSHPPGKSQVAIGFVRNTDTDPPQEAIGPLGPIAS